MAFIIDAERVKELRLAKKLSQEDLALACNLTISIISRIENNRNLIPRLNTIEKIAECLETTEIDIMKKVYNVSYEAYCDKIRNENKKNRKRRKKKKTT